MLTKERKREKYRIEMSCDKCQVCKAPPHNSGIMRGGYRDVMSALSYAGNVNAREFLTDVAAVRAKTRERISATPGERHCRGAKWEGEYRAGCRVLFDDDTGEDGVRASAANARRSGHFRQFGKRSSVSHRDGVDVENALNISPRVVDIPLPPTNVL